LLCVRAQRLATNVLHIGETCDIPLAEHGLSVLSQISRNILGRTVLGPLWDHTSGAMLNELRVCERLERLEKTGSQR
jgi:hypothetical protein